MQIHPMRKLGQTLCFSLILMGSGCATWLGHFGDCGSTPAPGVYRGTVIDAGFIAGPFSAGGAEYWEALPMGLLDLPFSIVADTIIFPFDWADYIDRKEKPVSSDTIDQLWFTSMKVTLKDADSQLHELGAFTNNDKYIAVHSYTNQFLINGTNYQCELAAECARLRDLGFLTTTTNRDLVWIDARGRRTPMEGRKWPPGF